MDTQDMMFGKKVNNNPCCWKCLSDNDEHYFGMLVCKKCGNKRCPKASDHTLDCTNSNEVNQKGSIYDNT